MGKSPVLTITHDPQQRGGAQTVTLWYRAWMRRHRPEENVEVYLDESGRFASSVDGVATWRWTREGALPRLLPKLHVPQYLLGKLLLSNESFKEVHVLGGVGLHGVMSGAPEQSIAWIGTTIRDERSATLPHQRRSKRLAYRLTLPVVGAMEERFLRQASVVLAQSHHTAALLLKAGLPPRRVHIVPVPVDTSVFRPSGAEREGLLFVGRANDPRKNFVAIQELVERSGLARREGVDVVSELPPRHQAADRSIRWRGWVESLAESMGTAKVLLMPSHQEGLGIVAFEALAAGTPVVAMKCGGPDHFLRESGGAIVATTAREFREAVEFLLRSPLTGREMGLTGRRWVESNMSAHNFLTNPGLFRLK